MKFTLRFSPLVARDMENIIAQTREHFGERKCEQYKLLMRLALADIAADPFAHPAKHRSEIHRDARTFHLSRQAKRASHFFVYRVVDETHVEISRLLHDSMDVGQQLPPGFGASDPS